LSTRLKIKEEKIYKILTSLSEESLNGTPIIVEGKKDIIALRMLGIKGIIITVKTKGKSFLDVISEIQKTNVSEIILFLDFDKRGKEATKHLQKNLEHLKIRYNLTFWRELHNLTRKELQYIESLPVYLGNIHRKIFRKYSSA
jgi:2,5-diamino-6-(ribosylamino)-4(3H)-pyrimidinone 5'-phosphate reductase